MNFIQRIFTFSRFRKESKMENNTPKKIMCKGMKINGVQLLDGLQHVESENDTIPVLIDFSDVSVPIYSMQISRTYEGHLEGRPAVINTGVLEEEQYKLARAGDGYCFVPPILYGEREFAFFGCWRFEINFEYWTKSSPEKEYSDQMYTLTLVLFSNKISDDQVPLGQYLSKYVSELNFFDLAHKCTEEEMDW